MSKSFPCLLPKQGASWFRIWEKVGACPGVWLEGWLRWSAHPFGGIECRGDAQCPAFAPNTLLLLLTLQKWQLGLVFLYLIVHDLPQLHMHAVIFNPL